MGCRAEPFHILTSPSDLFCYAVVPPHMVGGIKQCSNFDLSDHMSVRSMPLGQKWCMAGSFFSPVRGSGEHCTLTGVIFFSVF